MSPKTKDLATNKDISLVLRQTVSSREKVVPSCLGIDLQLFTMLGKKLHRLQDIGGVEPSDMLCPIGQKSHMKPKKSSSVCLTEVKHNELREPL